MPGTRTAQKGRLVGDERQPRGDDAAAAGGLEEDVDAVVLAVRAGDAEEQRQPAPEAEPALLREPCLEDELVSLAAKIAPLLLRDAVQENLKVRPDTSRKLHARPFAHPP